VLRFATRLGTTPGRLLAAFAAAAAIALAALIAGADSGTSTTERCLPVTGASDPATTKPAVIALLGDDIDDGGGFEGPHEQRLLRISLPGGEVQDERTLGERLPNRAIDRDDSYRLNVARAPLLAATGDGRAVVALVREPAPRRDSFAVIDPASLDARCTHPLERGVRYSGLVLGRSGKVYAYGARRAGIPGRWDAVLTVADAETGAVVGSPTLREADRGKWRGWGTDWSVYGGAVSGDERRLVFGYHGHDTTGADVWRVSPEGDLVASDRERRLCGDRFSRRECERRFTDVGWAHGAVAAVGRGFVAAAAEQGLLRLDRDGRVVGRVRVATTKSHLMDLAVDGDRSLVYTSTCGRRPAIQRVDLARSRSDALPSGPFCGNPLAVHGDRFLVLAASRVGKRGYPSLRPQRLRLIDLDDPGPGRQVRRLGAPLDALVVAPGG
jgi:hypothetical protein